MAGYSGTPLPQKLGVKAATRLGLVRPPADFASSLGSLPDGVVPSDAARRAGPFDVLVCFVRTRAELSRDLRKLPGKLDPQGGLWIAWPKRASGVGTDLHEAQVRGLGLATGLVDNKVCAIDEVWSGLRFVVRLSDRPKKR